MGSGHRSTRWRVAPLLATGILLLALAPALASTSLVNLASIEVVKLGARVDDCPEDGARRAGWWLQVAESWWPGNAVTAARLGDLRLAVGDRDGALVALERAGMLGASPVALAKLGDLYEREGRVDAAVGAWARAGGVQFCISRADDQMKLGNSDQAVRILLAARGVHPDALEVDGKLASLLISLGERGRAASLLREGLAARRGEVEGYLLLSRVLAAGSSTERAEAASVLRQAAERFPGDPRPLIALAELHVGQGDRQAAVAEYELAVERAPSDGSLYLELAALQAQLGRHQEALRTLEAGYRLAGRSFDLAMALVLALERAGGDLSGAELVVVEASSLAGNSGDAYGEVAEWYRGKGRYEDAAAEYLKAARYASHRQFAWLGPWRAAECYEALGDWVRAAGSYREAIAGIADVGAPPRFAAEILTGAAGAELRLGQEAAALELLRRAVRVDPANSGARAQLAALEMRVGGGGGQ